MLKSFWQSLAKAPEAAGAADVGLTEKPTCKCFLSKQRTENWKKKKNKTTKKNTPQPSQKTAKRKATLQLLYLVGCFWWNPFWLKQHNPCSFPGVSQVWWGTALGSVGMYLFFCILYCVWIQKIDRRNTFRSPGEPESIFSQTLPCSHFRKKQAERNVSTIRSLP